MTYPCSFRISAARLTAHLQAMTRQMARTPTRLTGMQHYIPMHQRGLVAIFVLHLRLRRPVLFRAVKVLLSQTDQVHSHVDNAAAGLTARLAARSTRQSSGGRCSYQPDREEKGLLDLCSQLKATDPPVEHPPDSPPSASLPPFANSRCRTLDSGSSSLGRCRCTTARQASVRPPCARAKGAQHSRHDRRLARSRSAVYLKFAVTCAAHERLEDREDLRVLCVGHLLCGSVRQMRLLSIVNLI